MEKNLSAFNDQSPTHFHQQKKTLSLIDLVLHPQPLPFNLFWKVYDDLFGSDHYSVITDLPYAPSITSTPLELQECQLVRLQVSYPKGNLARLSI